MHKIIVVAIIVLTIIHMMCHKSTPKTTILVDIHDNNITLKYCKNFLSAKLCDSIINQIDETKFIKSNISFGDDDFCTSKTLSLPSIDPFAKILNEKICNILQIDPIYGEELQVQKYDLGDEFKDHTDYFSEDVEVEMDNIKQYGQRTWTFIIYLNDVEKGGHTDFKHSNLSIKPEKGMALVWYNLQEGSEIKGNQYTLHAFRPVKAGNQYMITKWFRTKPIQ